MKTCIYYINCGERLITSIQADSVEKKLITTRFYKNGIEIASIPNSIIVSIGEKIEIPYDKVECEIKIKL